MPYSKSFFWDEQQISCLLLTFLFHSFWFFLLKQKLWHFAAKFSLKAIQFVLHKQPLWEEQHSLYWPQFYHFCFGFSIPLPCFQQVIACFNDPISLERSSQAPFWHPVRKELCKILSFSLVLCCQYPAKWTKLSSIFK